MKNLHQPPAFWRYFYFCSSIFVLRVFVIGVIKFHRDLLLLWCSRFPSEKIPGHKVSSFTYLDACSTVICISLQFQILVSCRPFAVTVHVPCWLPGHAVQPDEPFAVAGTCAINRPSLESMTLCTTFFL